MRLIFQAVLLILGIGITAPASADAVSDLRDGREGEIEFFSRTPTGPTELMTGRGAKTMVSGYLRFPAGRQDHVPAMIIAHGSGGITPGREHAWADRLLALGIATLVIDSFGPRGITSTATDQSQLATVANVADAFFGLALLATHPRIDPSHIGIMGFSKGGQVALYTALEPFRKGVLSNNLTFATHIAFYASCSIPYLGQVVANSRLLMLSGAEDDYTPAPHCMRYADWFQSNGADVEMIIFPGAKHGFDTPASSRFLARVQSARACEFDIRLQPLEGVLWKTDTIIPAAEITSHIRHCVERGASFGGNAAALQDAIIATTREVRARLLLH